MINISEVLETNKMIQDENLDVRTITMGISLLDCADAGVGATCEKIRAKILRLAGGLVRTGEDISREFGIPIVNKRVSITPISLVGAACCRTPADYVTIARTLDRTAAELGVNEMLVAKPNDAVALNLKAAIEAEQGKLKEAENTLDQAIMSNPRSPQAYYNMADLMLKRNPPNAGAARRYYETGRAMGGQRDERLEAALK